MKYLNLLLAMVLLSGGLSAQTVFTHPDDWDKVLDQARLEKKLIFLDAYTDWCGWCRVMDQKTFSDPVIGAFMNQHFVNIKIEMEKEELGKMLSMKYGVFSFPTFLIFDSEGRMVQRLMGYSPPDQFMGELIKAINPETHIRRPGYSAGLSGEYPPLFKSAMGMDEESGKQSKKKKKKKDSERKFPDSTHINHWFQANPQLSVETNWSAYKRFYHSLNGQNIQLFWDQYDTLSYLFGRDETEELASDLIYLEVKTLIPLNDIGEVNKLLDKRKNQLPKTGNQSMFVRIYYFKQTHQWKEVADILDSLFIHANTYSAAWWNQCCWDIYENCDDPVSIEKALKWIEAACKKEPEYHYLDTYAALLYKAGRLEEAETKAREAIEVGKSKSIDVSDTEALLKKILKAMKAGE